MRRGWSSIGLLVGCSRLMKSSGLFCSDIDFDGSREQGVPVQSPTLVGCRVSVVLQVQKSGVWSAGTFLMLPEKNGLPLE